MYLSDEFKYNSGLLHLEFYFHSFNPVSCDDIILSKVTAELWEHGDISTMTSIQDGQGCLGLTMT